MMHPSDDVRAFCAAYEELAEEFSDITVSFQPTPDEPMDEVGRSLRLTIVRLDELDARRKALAVPAELGQAVAPIAQAMDFQLAAYRKALSAIETNDWTELATASQVLSDSAIRVHDASLLFLSVVRSVSFGSQAAQG
jgi:hypothetical protein